MGVVIFALICVVAYYALAVMPSKNKIINDLRDQIGELKENYCEERNKWVDELNKLKKGKSPSK